MRLVLVLLIPAFLLVGCGLAARQAARDEIRNIARAEKAECERLYPNKFRKPVMPRIRCLNSVVLKENEGYDRVRLPAYEFPQFDLVQALTSRMLVTAEKYDHGQLTQAQYEAAVHEAVADYTSQLFQRSQMAAQTQAAQATAAAAVTATMPKSTTCVGTGHMVTCY